MAELTLHRFALQQLFSGAGSPVTRHLSRISDRTVSNARRNAEAQRRTGELDNSIHAIPLVHSSGPSFEVIATAPYSMAQHEGSVAHIIRPRNKKALHFFWERYGDLETFVPARGLRGGISVVRRGVLIIGKGFVNHPGNPATKFLLRALEEAVAGG